MLKYLTNFLKVSLFGLLFVLNCAYAQEEQKPEFSQVQTPPIQAIEEQTKIEQEAEVLKGVEVLSGFCWNKLKAKTDFDEKPDYNFYPIIVDLDFDLKNLTKRIGFNPASLVEFQLEPYIGIISSPKSNAEIGNSFMLKLGLFPEDWKFQPFVKAGAGMVYFTLHTEEQSTQFNFISSACLGAHYFFNKNVSLVMEGRFRHLSNASIDQPNSGINTYQALAGISYKY